MRNAVERHLAGVKPGGNRVVGVVQGTLVGGSVVELGNQYLIIGHTGHRAERYRNLGARGGHEEAAAEVALEHTGDCHRLSVVGMVMGAQPHLIDKPRSYYQSGLAIVGHVDQIRVNFLDV